ncbi:response regulator transcription factor [Embleya sp. NBC_00896]|uniref:response regulator transcription factor n=1 Tax=Embleya sp. NBC_00896 TaxID=2975961 RepID=UPI002F913280|nr:response regulator transcription factor [Embleya sp. NBC_00896]
MTLRIIYAEDDYLVREGVAALLGHVDGLDVVATATDLPELLTAVAEHLPDAVLTDIRMPPTHTDEGVRAARLIRDAHPGIGVVVLSQHVEAAYARDLLAAGAEGLGYLLKERVGHVDHLLRALQDVARGGTVLDPRVVATLLAERRATADSTLDRLTPREREVLALMAEGLNNAHIATTLTVSLRAVEKHINAVFAKLGVVGEAAVHQRVKAVLAFLDDEGRLSSD